MHPNEENNVWMELPVESQFP